FYKRKHIDRKTFIVHRKRMRIVKTFNDNNDRKIFDSKSKFNQKYSSHIKRGWLDVSKSNISEFESFIKKHKKFFVKQIDGSHGKGIRVIDITNEKDIKKLFKDLSKEKCIIEELIVQHKNLAEFNPTSVNTLRVVTLL